jgi:hypothetical protein
MESLISLPPNESTFEISIKGETSTQMWTGKFKCVCVPTLKQRADASVLEKQLGRDLTTIDSETLAYHRMIAQLSSRLLAAPDWWIASSNGQNLLDLNVVFEVWKLCVEAEKAWKDKVWKEEKKEEKKVESTSEADTTEG